ncbi:NADH-quinone oxidoreductase subunit G [Nostocoides veronense]|uniref:NADH-quinone oxidoreductase n=1 Tax=Nostocoides veronense TaxID=330836 RepID=A0ABP4XM80_9MICO
MSAQDLVNLTIDGIPVSVPKGTLIIRAAEQIGIQIPRFCDHPSLEPQGSCRQCLVEVALPGPPGPDGTPGALRQMQGPPGRMKPQPSCVMTVSEGMDVKTQFTSPGAEKAQHGVMELLLINHPLDCPVCDKGGECPLQNQAMSSGRPVSRFEDFKRTYPKPINISSQVLLDRERCVLCARCTRFSDQIAGDPFIALVERGALQQVGIYEDQPFESYFSGNTVQICPVGALTGAAYRFRSRPFDLVSTPGACEHCASGCAIRTDHRRGTVLRRMAINDPEVNDEWNCDKGRWAFASPTVGDRISLPLVRGASGQLEVASWPEALAAAAAGLQGRKAGVLTGGRISSEDAYAYGKFARTVLGTNAIDFRARPHTKDEARFLAAAVAATGPEGGSVTYAHIEKAPKVLLVGFEPEEESPIVFLRLRKAMRRNKTQISSIAPYATRGLTKLAGALIPAAPGTETEILTSEVAREAVSGEGSLILAGERLAMVPGALAAALTLAEETGAALAWIPRRAGERGALEAGALSGLLPGGRPAGNIAARDEVAKAWGVASLPTDVGLDTAGMIAAAASGALGALVVGGVDAADLGDDTAYDALEKAFVVSLEYRPSSVTAYADVVLPVAPHAEKSGTFVDWEGRVRPFEAALETNALSDYRVLDLLAGELGEFLGTRSLAQVQAEMAALGPWTGPRAPRPEAVAATLPALNAGQYVLATWHHLLDKGSLQDGEPFLAGTAPKAVARLSPAGAAALGAVDGDHVTVTGPDGAITLPLAITEMVEGVVWVPTNSAGSRVATLGAGAGSLVTLTTGGAV